jgi:hypothetical protein
MCVVRLTSDPFWRPLLTKTNSKGMVGLTSDPFLWSPLTRTKIRYAVGLTWDPFWGSPSTRTKIRCVVGLIWNPFWRSPLTRTKIHCVVLPIGRVWTCFFLLFENFLMVRFFSFLHVLGKKLWFFVIINLMTLSSSTILLDFIEDLSVTFQ